jgi:D-arabinose 1-dehydrogenase-like Zn-dependent alcohol dehydrogenase
MEFDRVGAELAEILDMMEKGLVSSPPLTRYRLDAGARALQHMKDGRVRGKIVLETGA